MKSHFILNRLFTVLFILNLIGCATTSTPVNDYPVVDRPAFMDDPLTQAELDSATSKWVSDLIKELRKTPHAFDINYTIDSWLEKQYAEVKEELKDSVDGTLYNTEYNICLANRILHKIKSIK